MLSSAISRLMETSGRGYVKEHVDHEVIHRKTGRSRRHRPHTVNLYVLRWCCEKSLSRSVNEWFPAIVGVKALQRLHSGTATL